MLVKAQIAHATEAAGESGPDEVQHALHVAVQAGLVELFQSKFDELGVVFGGFVFEFPGIVAFEGVEFGGSGLPVVVAFGLCAR